LCLFAERVVYCQGFQLNLQSGTAAATLVIHADEAISLQEDANSGVRRSVVALHKKFVTI
jgi:hypothetical protein